MRAVIQRVSEASVAIDGAIHASIGVGYLLLLGVSGDDGSDDVEWLAKKVAKLRVFGDERGVMNRSLGDVGGNVLVVSQFTLFASYRSNNRPSWCKAAPPAVAVPLYEAFCSRLSQEIRRPVSTGVFGADMQVSLVNDGPVTICIDTKRRE